MTTQPSRIVSSTPVGLIVVAATRDDWAAVDAQKEWAGRLSGAEVRFLLEECRGVEPSLLQHIVHMFRFARREDVVAMISGGFCAGGAVLLKCLLAEYGIRSDEIRDWGFLEIAVESEPANLAVLVQAETLDIPRERFLAPVSAHSKKSLLYLAAEFRQLTSLCLLRDKYHFTRAELARGGNMNELEVSRDRGLHASEMLQLCLELGLDE